MTMRRFSGFLPSSIWVLSISFLLMNISSVIVFSFMPFFLTMELGLSSGRAGAIEGAVEGFSLFIRAFAGSLSDFVAKRKNFIVVGYIFSLISRMCLSIAGSLSLVILSRLADKLGNGIQASPREAFINDNTPKTILGRAYGFNKALGMIGSMIGALLLIAVFEIFQTIHFKHIFWMATALVAVATLMLMVGIKDTPKLERAAVSLAHAPERSLRSIVKTAWNDIRLFRKEYWKVMAVAFLFKLGYFSGSYIILLFDMQKFPDFMGISLVNKPYLVGPIVMLIQNILSGFSSLPFGYFSDRIGQKRIVAVGLVCMIFSLLFFAYFPKNQLLLCFGVMFYGLQMGMQGVLLSMLASTLPKERDLSGTGFGLFYLVTGVSVVTANEVFMRPLWDGDSPRTAFMAILIPIALALVLLSLVRTSRPQE